MSVQPTPPSEGADIEASLCTTDPGDDTLRRFRYQFAYTAILALGMLDDEAALSLLYCEHHDDVLLKLSDGKFRAVQIKTRDCGLEPFKAREEQILNSLKRFIGLETKYPNVLDRFTIAANCGFWRERKDGHNLPYVLELAMQCLQNNGSQPARPLSGMFNCLRDGNGITDAIILGVLGKTTLQDNLPHLDGVEDRLIRHLHEVETLQGLPYSALGAIAQALVNIVFRAASHACDPLLRDYCAILNDPGTAEAQAVIQGKRINPGRLHQLFAEHSTSTALLRARSPAVLAQLPPGMSVLERKMARGMIPVRSVELAKDHKYSTEYQLVKLLNKYGPERAEEFYQHLRLMVKTECHEAYDAAEQADEPFGQQMLGDVRHRLKSRYQLERDTLLGCTYEHLQGVAGVLTEECEVWWSLPFDIPDGTAP